jgi:transcriptional regulator
MSVKGTEVLQGTLDLLILKTLETMGPMHGYAIARRFQQVSEDAIRMNQGSLYPTLLKLADLGWITAKWGTTENSREARYYSITRAGRRQLRREERNWGRVVAMIDRVLEAN